MKALCFALKQFKEILLREVLDLFKFKVTNRITHSVLLPKVVNAFMKSLNIFRCHQLVIIGNANQVKKSMSKVHQVIGR